MSLLISFYLNLRLTINAMATRLGKGCQEKEGNKNKQCFMLCYWCHKCLSLNPQEWTEPWAKEKICDGGKTSLSGDRLTTDTISE